jgi:general secretion pathway protein C
MRPSRHQTRALQTRHPAPRGFRLFAAGVLALTAYAHADGFSQLVRAGLWAHDTPVAHAREASPPVQAPQEKSAAAILARNPFDHEQGPLREPEEEAPQAQLAPDDVPRCKGIVADGLVASDDPKWSFALLRTSLQGDAMLRRVGGAAGGYSVAYVFPRRVLMERAGAFCQIVLGEGSLAPVAAPAQERAPAAPVAAGAGNAGSTLDPAISSGIVRRGDGDYEISAEARDRVLANTATLLTARAVPILQDGKPLGIRLSGIKPGSVLSLIGLENGDVLMTVNGFEIADPQKALEAYARLRTADRMSLQLRRANRDKTVDFTVK